MPLLTQVLQKFRLTVKFASLDQDGAKVTRSKEYNLVATGADDAARYAAAQSAVATALPIIAAVSDGDIVGHELTGVHVTTDVVTATGNMYKELSLTLESGLQIGKGLNHTIINPAATILVGGRNVDPASVAVGNYLNLFVTGGNFRISDGEYISAAANPILADRVKTVSSGKRY